MFSRPTTVWASVLGAFGSRLGWPPRYFTLVFLLQRAVRSSRVDLVELRSGMVFQLLWGFEVWYSDGSSGELSVEAGEPMRMGLFQFRIHEDSFSSDWGEVVTPLLKT